MLILPLKSQGSVYREKYLLPRWSQWDLILGFFMLYLLLCEFPEGRETCNGPQCEAPRHDECLSQYICVFIDKKNPTKCMHIKNSMAKGRRSETRKQELTMC